MAGRDRWAKEFADKRKAQIARADELADIEHDRLAALPEREGPIVADQVFQGTTISQKAAEGDPGARLQAVGTTLTEPNPETGEYEVTAGEAGGGVGSELPSEGEFEEGQEPTESPEDGTTVEGTLEDLSKAERTEEEKAAKAGGY